MATIASQPCRFVKSEYGDAGLYETIVNNSTAVIDGELGVLTNDGFTTCGANPTVITHLALKASAAVGTNTIPGDTTAYQSFLKIRRGDIFEMNMSTAGVCTAATAVIAASDIDAQADYGITQDTTTGYWTVDTAKSGANQVLTVIKGVGTFGDVGQRVLVKFLATTAGAL